MYYLRGKVWKKLTLVGVLVQEPEYHSAYSEYPIGWAGRGSNPESGKRDFSFPQCPDGLRGFFLGERRPQPEVSHSLDLAPRLRKRESGVILLLPPYPFMAWTATLLTAPMDLCYSFFSVSRSDFGVIDVTTGKTSNEGITQHYGAFA